MIYAGTSGWAYAQWKPEFYPAKLATAKFLEHYAARLSTVEVNYTFRHHASEKTLDNWVKATSAGFRFSLKAHQRITHIKRLREAGEDARAFLAGLRPLEEAGKLGLVLFQLPPYLKADAALLTDFLQGLPRAGRFAFEFRHASWFADATWELLRRHNAAVCFAETEKLETPEVVTADYCYYRLRKPDYSPAEVRALAAKLAEHTRAKRDVYVYFKHEETPEGALNAERLLKLSF